MVNHRFFMIFPPFLKWTMKILSPVNDDHVLYLPLPLASRKVPAPSGRGLVSLPPRRKNGGRRWPVGQIFDWGEEIVVIDLPFNYMDTSQRGVDQIAPTPSH